MKRTVVVMGVSGCGKSTITGILARRLGRNILEGDSLHRYRAQPAAAG